MGDTCDIIAIATGTAAAQLLALNPWVDPECTNLNAGQVLCLRQQP